MKNFLTAFLLCLTVIMLDAQVNITKDYTRNGSRIVEINFDGVSYSLIMSNFDQNREASLFFENIIRRKPIKLKISEGSSEVLELKYSESVLMKARIRENSIVYDKNEIVLSEADKKDLRAFREVLDDLNPDWPRYDEGGDGPVVAQTWEVIAVTGGGSLSLASARCSFVQQSYNMSENCIGTTDCGCLYDNFLCLCICGVLCND